MSTSRVLAQVITGDFLPLAAYPTWGTHPMQSQVCGAMKLAYALPVCGLLMSSPSVIVLNPRAGAITDHSQTANDIDSYIKSQLNVEDPGHRKPVLILPNGLDKPGERAQDRK